MLFLLVWGWRGRKKRSLEGICFDDLVIFEACPVHTERCTQVETTADIKDRATVAKVVDVEGLEIFQMFQEQPDGFY